MDTSLLLEILETRIAANDNNPTSGSLLRELHIKLTDLKRREDAEALEKQ